MWVVTLGPFRGKRMQKAKIVGLVVLVLLLALLVWQVLEGYFAGPEPEVNQRAQVSVAAADQPREYGLIERVLVHLRIWYREGF